MCLRVELSLKCMTWQSWSTSQSVSHAISATAAAAVERSTVQRMTSCKSFLSGFLAATKNLAYFLSCSMDLNYTFLYVSTKTSELRLSGA